MSILRSAMCKMGRHSGRWSLPGRRCEAVLVCEFCGKRQERSRHDWGPFGYLATGRCEQDRRCRRCGEAQQQTRHEWGPWLYAENEMNSPQVHTCRRCHLSERSSHTWR